MVEVLDDIKWEDGELKTGFTFEIFISAAREVGSSFTLPELREHIYRKHEVKPGTLKHEAWDMCITRVFYNSMSEGRFRMDDEQRFVVAEPQPAPPEYIDIDLI